MLRFFRHIRQSVIEKGQVKKYLLYAVGEILLVVIGILLALQVNNWNELQKEKKVEIKLLKEVQIDLEATMEEIIGDYEAHIQSQNSGNTFQRYLVENEIFNDTILMHYKHLSLDRQVYPKTSGYDLLQAKGMDIISNDSLRKEITDLYQLTFFRLVEFGQSNEKFNIPKRLSPFDNKHFSIINIPASRYKTAGLIDSVTFYQKRLTNYADLRNDNEFLRVLQSSFGLRRRKIFLHEWAIEDSKNVIFLIKEELKHLE